MPAHVKRQANGIKEATTQSQFFGNKIIFFLIWNN